MCDNSPLQKMLAVSSYFTSCHLWQACEKAGGTCATVLDGYYIESLVCVVIGILWLRTQSRRVKQLQELPQSAWTCSSS